MKRIGIFGGSFDPVHKGHIHLAKTAMKCFDIDEVVFIPARISPFKQSKTDVSSGSHRLAMLRLTLENEPCMSVSDYELLQENVSYTVYTIRHMKSLYKKDELVLLMGSDMLLSFQKWYCWQEIMSLAELGCISRSSDDSEKLTRQAEILSKYGKINVFCKDILPLSSTEIRELLKKGEDCSCYLTENVVQYIIKHHLYCK